MNVFREKTTQIKVIYRYIQHFLQNNQEYKFLRIHNL